jgi:hypothetical protein
VGLECAKTGDYAGHCVDPVTKRMPGASHATPSGSSFRIVVDKLLDAHTFEVFACACHGHCTRGAEWIVDPHDCSACGEDEATASREAGRCLDQNRDRIPDLATLQDGVATLTCAEVPSFGSAGTYRTRVGDGYNAPSGNQLVSASDGYRGVGPAIVIEPAIALPTNSRCTIRLNDVVKDRCGVAVTSEPAEFRTAPLVATVAEGGGSSIALVFNAPVSPATVDAGSVTLRKDGTAVAAVTVSVDNQTVTLQPATPLEAGGTYDVVIASRVTDTYGRPVPEPLTWSLPTR